MKTRKHAIPLFCWALLCSTGLYCLDSIAQTETTVDDSPMTVVSQTNRELTASQQAIDKLDAATAKMLQTYREILQRKDYQQYYNFQLKNLKASQEKEIAALQKQLQALDYFDVALMPLMQSMLAALEEFVALDTPFHTQVRQQGLQKLRNRINGGDVSLPDKYRLLMEAWQIEHDYGRTVETWRGRLSDTTGQDDDKALAVDYLRVGRVAFYSLTLDRQAGALWDKDKRQWETLNKEALTDLVYSVKLASSGGAPELMPLPLQTRLGQ